MKNTLVPLTIVFFDTGGKSVRRLSMTPCREGSVRDLRPGRQYRFALELRATDERPAKRLGPSASSDGSYGSRADPDVRLRLVLGSARLVARR